MGDGPEGREGPQALSELWEEHTTIMVYDGKLSHAEAARLAWAGLTALSQAAVRPRDGEEEEHS